MAAPESEPATLVRLSGQRAVLLRASELRAQAQLAASQSLSQTRTRQGKAAATRGRGARNRSSVLPAGIRLFGDNDTPAVSGADAGGPKLPGVNGDEDDDDEDEASGGEDKGAKRKRGSESGAGVRVPPSDRWICSLAVVPFGDVFASGSSDGSVRLWKLNFVPHAGAASSLRDQSWQHVRYTAFAPLFAVSLVLVCLLYCTMYVKIPISSVHYLVYLSVYLYLYLYEYILYSIRVYTFSPASSTRCDSPL